MSESKKHDEWQTVERRYPIPPYNLVEEKLKTPSGVVVPWLYFDSKGSVLVLPFDGQKVYLLKQYRPPFRGKVWELPGGALKSREEPPTEAALRELAEETGFQAGELIALGRFSPLVGTTNLVVHVFLARDLTPGPVDLEPGEDIDVIAIPLSEFQERLFENEFLDSGIQFAGMRAKLLGLF